MKHLVRNLLTRLQLELARGTKCQGTGDGTSENPSAAAQESMTAPRARHRTAGLDQAVTSQYAERSGDAVSLEAKMGIVVSLNEGEPSHRVGSCCERLRRAAAPRPTSRGISKPSGSNALSARLVLVASSRSHS